MGSAIVKQEKKRSKITTQSSNSNNIFIYENNLQDYSSTGTHLYATLNNKIELDKPREHIINNKNKNKETNNPENNPNNSSNNNPNNNRENDSNNNSHSDYTMMNNIPYDSLLSNSTYYNTNLCGISLSNNNNNNNDNNSISYEVLLQRRGKHLREAFHWGIPGGGYDIHERNALRDLNFTREDLQWKISRRAALRETIEECGGGYYNPSPSHSSSSDSHSHSDSNSNNIITLHEIEELNIPKVRFSKIKIPPGLLNIIENESLTYGFKVPYGAKNKTAAIVMYILNDDESEAEWIPRAIPHFRSEVDEKYSKGNTQFGYVWVNLEDLLLNLSQPVSFSSSPLCAFIFTLFTLYGDQIRSIVSHHELNREK
mmetsp:Transcript_21610/g.22370  ORF Transcript_21610/g.22370 Transcript_21610/m.22370 type:complete len:371 (+) Transcript_21610:117-1229(+)